MKIGKVGDGGARMEEEKKTGRIRREKEERSG